MKDYLFLQQKYLVNTYINRQLTLVKGKGIYLYTNDHKKYLDAMSSYGVCIFGYNYPLITKALINQLKKITTLHCGFTSDVRSEASKQLVEKCGGSYVQVYWSNSGAEAMEAAIKFAALATGKRKFIACQKGFHGKTLGALSATAGDKYRDPFKPLLWHFTHIPYNNIVELEKAIDIDTAGFIVEPVQGEAGIIIPDKNYLKKVREVCNKHNIPLILDEIQTGTGRTGEFLASHSSGICGDIVCLGKGLSGGIPVGATVVTEKIGKAIHRGSHTSTFGGNPLACAGAIAVMNLLNKKQLDYVKTMGEYFLKSLKKIKSEKISDVRGLGFMIGVEIKGDRNIVLKRLQNVGILVIPGGDQVVRFLPPFIITKKQIDIVIKKLSEVLE